MENSVWKPGRRDKGALFAVFNEQPAGVFWPLNWLAVESYQAFLFSSLLAPPAQNALAFLKSIKAASISFSVSFPFWEQFGVTATNCKRQQSASQCINAHLCERSQVLYRGGKKKPTFMFLQHNRRSKKFPTCIYGYEGQTAKEKEVIYSICAWLMRNLFSLHGGIELLEPHVHIPLICTVFVLWPRRLRRK